MALLEWVVGKPIVILLIFTKLQAFFHTTVNRHGNSNLNLHLAVNAPFYL